MSKVLGNVLGLIHECAAHRPGINLDQSDEIRVFATDELRNVIENAPTAA
jgi:hypothetical protein